VNTAALIVRSQDVSKRKKEHFFAFSLCHFSTACNTGNDVDDVQFVFCWFSLTFQHVGRTNVSALF
jgi:hypothetical protein